MAKDNAQSSFQRGVMSLLILSLLDQEDMYGYQIVQEIAARSGGTIVTQEGSLYPVLYKLISTRRLRLRSLAPTISRTRRRGCRCRAACPWIVRRMLRKAKS